MSGILGLFTACDRHPPMLESLPAATTGIAFVNRLPDKPGLGILSYIYYYNGAGVAAGDINGDGFPDLYFTSNTKGGNKLYLNRGNFHFEDITTRAGVAGSSDWCTGVTMADVNGDGRLDIYVCAVANMQGFQGRNQLFINKGDGTFADSAAAYGLDFSGFATQAVFFDYDHDGDLDCFILNQSQHPNQHITDTASRRGFDPNAGERLFRNDHGHFTDVSAAAGLYRSSLCYGLGVAVADLNNDGWEDIYVGNDFHENDFEYINNGNGTFTESGAAHFRHYSRYSMGNDIADFDNDGNLDIVTADMLPGDEKTLKTYGNGEHLDVYQQKIVANGYQDQYSRNALQHNNGDGRSFSDIGLIAGISATDWSWSPLFVDLDNDGNKDLFISSGIVHRPLDLDFINFFANLRDPSSYGGPDALQKAMTGKMPDGSSHPFVFQNAGRLQFTDRSDAWGTAGVHGYFNGAAYADLDNDGNEDIVINCLEGPAVILQNHAPKKHWLNLVFDASVARSPGNGTNRFGIGTKAYVFTGKTRQYQQLMLTRGFESSTEPRLHFGLGESTHADSILIIWPNQRSQVLYNQKADTTITIRQQAASTITIPHQQSPTTETTLPWRHHENNYIDFKQQYLIPHMQSTRGPKLAVGDVNGDGLDDFFVCGARGQPGALFIQQANGSFTPTDTALFARNSQSEGVDATFFDANGDGHPDLYVVTGGAELPDGDSALADHFYLNDGHGHFSEAPLPKILINKSCVSAADVNGDGAIDLFVGGGAMAGRFGAQETPSYLLINDGHARFKQTLLFTEKGIPTSAAFADLDGDGTPDLVVAGEWMNIKVFTNHHGSLQESQPAGPKGLWQTVKITDVDGDGRPDILAGNWGLNTKLAAGKDGPLNCYVKDLDGNGTVEQLLTYFIGGEEFPFLGKDQLELALPALKRSHLRYDEVAGKNIRYLFGNQLDDARILHVDTLASLCLFNNGQGGFIPQNLPAELQLSPIFSFAAINDLQYLAAGNFYGVQPYEGRYDAANPTIFTYDKGFRSIGGLTQQPGEWRDAKLLRTGAGRLLLLARNNERLLKCSFPH
ncbi:MAG TPA: VCBS repeat-containing protein [Puia sp.]|uniref:VCBS repeat-containing protein n=1 Tax=Puia sp. TaxID=2045100 RepID=UPI002C1B226F|nr:VCBS repeat-containing protein [Puia sp.]HVU94082.1 VCBS repeat-containing protein [Puia sp.]